MPADVLIGKVTRDMNETRRVSVHQPGKLLTTSIGRSFDITPGEMTHFPLNSDVHIYRSALLSAVIKVENFDHTFVVNNLGSIYRNFSFGPILLFIGCVLGIVIKSGVEFHVNLGIVVFLITVLNIALLYLSRI
jgi:hypothetical protein